MYIWHITSCVLTKWQFQRYDVAMIHKFFIIKKSDFSRNTLNPVWSSVEKQEITGANKFTRSLSYHKIPLLSYTESNREIKIKPGFCLNLKTSYVVCTDAKQVRGIVMKELKNIDMFPN